MKIVKSFGESGILLTGISETIRNEAKEQKDGFLGILIGTLETSLLGNTLMDKTAVTASDAFIQAVNWTVRAGENFWCHLTL